MDIDDKYVIIFVYVCFPVIFVYTELSLEIPYNINMKKDMIYIPTGFQCIN